LFFVSLLLGEALSSSGLFGSSGRTMCFCFRFLGKSSCFRFAFAFTLVMRS
jgi:hypothetical protein